MCDAGDLVDAGAAVATGGVSVIYKKATGNDLPAVSTVKGLVTKPEVPKLAGGDPLAPPAPIDPTNMIIQRAMSAARLRSLNGGMGASFLTGPGGLKDFAPLALPKAGGY